jgi:hypothetical protein
LNLAYSTWAFHHSVCVTGEYCTLSIMVDCRSGQHLFPIRRRIRIAGSQSSQIASNRARTSLILSEPYYIGGTFSPSGGGKKSATVHTFTLCISQFLCHGAHSFTLKRGSDKYSKKRERH